MYARYFSGALAALTFAAGFTAVAHAQSNNLEPNNLDRQFVVKAIKMNDAEIRDAVRNRTSRDPNVRIFAEQMIKDHLYADSQIAAYADHRGIAYPKTLIRKVGEGSTLPAVPAADSTDVKEHQTGHVAKNPTVRPMAPRAYMAAEVNAHRAALALYEDEARNGADQQLKVLVGSLLPVVKAHLQMAQDYLAGRKMTLPSPEPAQNNMQAPAPSTKPPRG